MYNWKGVIKKYGFEKVDNYGRLIYLKNIRINIFLTIQRVVFVSLMPLDLVDLSQRVVFVSLMPLDLVDLSESLHQARPQDATSRDQPVRSVPFAFDILGLLSKCQQVELLFSTCIQGSFL